MTQHKTRGVALIRPVDPVYPKLPPIARKLPLVEDWVDAALFARNWKERSAAFEALTHRSMTSIFGFNVRCAHRAISGYVSCALEHLCETEISRGDAASWYLLARHAAWQAAGRQFIAKTRPGAFLEFRRSNPGYDRAFAALASQRSA
ncbi:hypothetical protein [Rhodoplanes roseus]|uniref:hypothetical protein n=1 Tax=Rhodoplanes roseus TaxID=29409 RepID=UPI0011B439C6|nr:hypothetical protein [Rhodoplanes roseus]